MATCMLKKKKKAMTGERKEEREREREQWRGANEKKWAGGLAGAQPSLATSTAGASLCVAAPWTNAKQSVLRRCCTNSALRSSSSWEPLTCSQRKGRKASMFWVCVLHLFCLSIGQKRGLFSLWLLKPWTTNKGLCIFADNKIFLSQLSLLGFWGRTTAQA